MSGKKQLPEKLNYPEIEKKWGEYWQKEGIYSWDPNGDRENSFVVDTPPPTVSGSLHLGHVFSYTHTDLIVRYQRMKGKNIFYPMGWDDNGLPTERRVQNVFNIKCDPTVAYQEGWQPQKAEEAKKDEKKEAQQISRQNFIEACQTLTHEDEKVYEHLWRRLALSVDWSLQYATIDDHCRKISQTSFLDLAKKGYVYAAHSPNMWDVDFQTAVAQAELEDRETTGNFHDIEFAVEGEGSFVISTTRPELLASCIAVVAHPDDTRYQGLFGKFAITPLYGAKVPILPAAHADPQKGTGILMVCTFGDIMDVEFWKQSGLPIKQTIGRDGKMMPVEFGPAPFESLDSPKAQHFYGQIAGQPTYKAKKIMAEILQTEKVMANPPTPTKQAVKFYEKGDRPLEFIPTRQWYIKILQFKDQLLEQGRKIAWHPAHMLSRYEHWVEGLNQDWCVSRQRYFGVPFPVWYPIKNNDEIDYDHPLFAAADQLPVDPMITPP
ncbi:MAG: class I tRNA ligase family protein, partial [Pseudomonadota bacterium]